MKNGSSIYFWRAIEATGIYSQNLDCSKVLINKRYYIFLLRVFAKFLSVLKPKTRGTHVFCR
jgi:hypothetical protein